MKNFPQALLAEFIGTFALIFLGAGAGVLAGLGAGSLVTVALAHGLTIMFFAYSYGHISGVHINPAVSIGLAAAGEFPAWKVVPYILVQLVGAVIAGLALRGVFGGAETGLGATVIDYELTNLGGAFLLEFVGTFFLVNTVLNAAISGRAGLAAPFAIGMTVAACIMFFGPLTGASLNPARTIGPAVAALEFSDIWLYLLATPLGAIFAAVLWRGGLKAAAAPSQEDVPRELFQQ